MLSFMSLKGELALKDLELASLEISKFHEKKDEFISCFSEVEKVFGCYNLDD